ncbi:sensor domain-containing diguanylate cyclase [Thiobacillus sedimenti]|uniref:diguanylate cyclase n=1 Tax=Thiobacillus sedimenti TaxID=3110231 RepID=A0ABZ1CMJ3_9PROT|nr:diguanylate cyclase [Thiobacillus sp. SCUT-2]WRS39168.1 diguanylate cyclase [Thiobacillus sp. SCUT-2]
MLLLAAGAAAVAAPLPVLKDSVAAIGRSTEFLQERDGRLDLAAAVAAYRQGRFAPGARPVLDFGIGAKPVWIHFAVDNPTAAPVARRLSLETSWLDRVDVYFREGGATVARYRVGDTLPFAERPVRGRYFVFEHAFPPGRSDVFLRVETPDPMVVPLYLLDPETARARQAEQEFSYGIVYGFLFALMAYNAILFASLRSARYLFYSLYLALFVAMNIAYTGHGFAWLWPDAVRWQQWANPVLIVLYAMGGLQFAIRFLDLRTYFPRVRRAVIGFCAAFAGVLALAVVLGNQTLALLVSFSFAFLFTWLMLALGIVSVRAGQKAARYFLIAAFAAMVGALLTTLSVWGFIPNTVWTFRAVEIGMLVDATLLALALAYQLRVGQEERIRAQRLAQLDPLTALNNRRAFYDKTAAPWSQTVRHGHSTSVMLFDLDHFKALNDAHGHAHGDAVLRATAELLRHSVRQGDVAARWGGEEFIVFLPETDAAEAMRLAERLRRAIAAMRVPHDGGASSVTASFGLAQRNPSHLTLDALIAAADECLYEAKQQGRDRVTACGGGNFPAAALA